MEKGFCCGLRSLFVGFETLNEENLRRVSKPLNLGHSCEKAIRRLHGMGVMINASFVFGLDDDGPDVFDRTVDWDRYDTCPAIFRPARMTPAVLEAGCWRLRRALRFVEGDPSVRQHQAQSARQAAPRDVRRWNLVIKSGCLAWARPLWEGVMEGKREGTNRKLVDRMAPQEFWTGVPLKELRS